MWSASLRAVPAITGLRLRVCLRPSVIAVARKRSPESASYNCRHVDHRLPRRREASHALSAVAAPPDARLTASRSGMLLDLMLGDMGPGGLEDNPLTYGHGVVGEPFVVAAQQSDIDRGGDGVRPLAVHQDAEQKSM